MRYICISMFLFLFLFIDITHLLFELLCMHVCYLLFPINNNNNIFSETLKTFFGFDKHFNNKK